MCISVCLSRGSYTIRCVCFWRLAHSHVISTASNQEVLSNYRDAARSDGVPTQPIIWRILPCQGVILEEMELSYVVRKACLSRAPLSPPIHYFLTELHQLKRGWGWDLFPGSISI